MCKVIILDRLFETMRDLSSYYFAEQISIVIQRGNAASIFVYITLMPRYRLLE